MWKINRPMKKYFGLLYWSVMVVVMSLILMNIMGSFPAAFFLSLMLLPGIMLMKYLARDISFRNRKQGILHTAYLLMITLLAEYLAIINVCAIIHGFNEPVNLDIITNPVFIWFILVSLISIEKLLEIKLFPPGSEKREVFIRFVSDRRNISLEVDSITYIESRANEVFVMTASGESYRTRMKISQWEQVLDDRFVRVHRAFIVNRSHITKVDSHAVHIGPLPVEISRKYKESVMEKLG